jgi:hypothetical protein
MLVVETLIFNRQAANRLGEVHGDNSAPESKQLGLK